MNQTNGSLSQELVDEFVNIAHGYGPSGDFEQVREMVEKYPDLVHAVHSDGDETGLGAAAHMGERQIVQYLLDRGATLDIATAAMMGWREKVADFLVHDPTLATAKGAHGYALLYFVAQSGDTEMADLILKYGGGEGLKYPLQPLNTPSIHGAVLFGHPEMTQWFLERGADVTVRDYDDRTPLEAAVELGYDEIANLLRNHIGLNNLDRCRNCGEVGQRVVSRRDGNRWAEHTTYYACHACGVEMGSQERNE
ncbi:ankyrin repeat domain-containing protein [Chloroflexi bacterium TSY]|nr:ankyrin repeat domain-containing protein [Chloroflexi bacterium TSY]